MILWATAFARALSQGPRRPGLVSLGATGISGLEFGQGKGCGNVALGGGLCVLGPTFRDLVVQEVSHQRWGGGGRAEYGVYGFLGGLTRMQADRFDSGHIKLRLEVHSSGPMLHE